MASANKNGTEQHATTAAAPIAEKLKQSLPTETGNDDPDAHLKDRSMGRMLGDIVWLLTQSPAHKHFALADLEWMVLPPLTLAQYRIFRDGDKPVGVALWAYVSDDTEKKLREGATRIRPDEWAPDMRIDPVKGVTSGDGGNLWLIDLIVPFATAENKLADICLHDLMKNVFSGKRFKLFQMDAATGQRKVVELVG